MCSKCFREQEDQNKKEQVHESSAKPEPVQEKHELSPPITTPTPSEETPIAEPSRQEEPQEEQPPSKPVQKSTGRCFMCRTKIPLAKQLSNKCRCEYVFCDSHRYPDKHDCDFDHASMDKDILAKKNPKLNERPRGGRSFQRLDSM
ncbi:hypothetical protein BJV82DRAFT_578894 [Fennellomyces sp. T-0311]|nr:hypothetical protein BJV82DRAFT_578894 [Fennellomyces sp. T-0311]